MALIPQCSVCEDNNNLDSFKGFYQERYGQRRLIRPDGALGQYAHHAEASQAKKIHCASCHWSPPREKADLWASRYCWCWPDVPPQVQFDAKRVADGLEQFYRKNGSQMVRLTVPKSTLEYADYPQRLSSAVTALLKQSGKGRLYAYQAKALESLFENRVTVVQAPTGSGKSLIYQTFFLNGLVRNSSARMVALFPTQALTKDQARALVALTDREDDSPTIPALLTQSEYRVKALDRSFKLALFCGRDDDTHLNDATAQMLKRIKDTHVLMGTPDKLYVHLYKREFSKFLQDLELIVVDEAHMATGIFGGNCAYLIRRLLKLAPKAKLLIMSATFSNVREFAEVLAGEDVALVDGSDTVKHSREILLVPLWPRKRKSKSSELVTASTAVVETIAQLVEINGGAVPPGIVFGHSKRGLALLLRIMEKRIKDGEYPASLKNLPRIFKRDLDAEVKDELLQQMHDREIHLMLSTNALELGIDVGSIDFVVLEALPESDLSFLQRIGRAGRSRDGVAIAFIDQDPYQQHWLKQIAKSKRLSLETARPLPIAISNPNIIRNNFIRYAWEAKTHLSVGIDEVKRSMTSWCGHSIDKILAEFENGSSLSDFQYIEKLLHDPRANNLVSMRVAVNVDQVDIVDKATSRKKGAVSLNDFFRDLHEHAVWADENGTPYRVVDYKDYDPKSGFPKTAIVVQEKNSDRRTYGVVRIKQNDEIEGRPPRQLVASAGYFLKHGPFKIEEKSPGYFETVGEKNQFVSYDEDSRMSRIRRPKYETMGLLIHRDEWASPGTANCAEQGGVRGFLTLFGSVASHYVGASEGDVRFNFSDASGNVYVLDVSVGGNGVSEQIARNLSGILKTCLRVLKECGCKTGCFSCVWPKRDDSAGDRPTKLGTAKVVKWLIGVGGKIHV